MKNNRKIVMMIVFCFSQFFIQCSSDDNKDIQEKIITQQYTDEVIMLRNFLSANMSIDIEKIIYVSSLDAFIIDVDGKIPLDDARDHFNNYNTQITNKTNHQYNGLPVSIQNSGSVKVYISPEVPPQWQIAVKEAISNWNMLNSSINITLVSAKTPYSINVIALNTGTSGYKARANFPTGDQQPGKLIEINTYYNNMSASEKNLTMTHELGHTFGLCHTGENQGPRIDCTPFSDTNSFMNTLIIEWKGFSAFDNIAISILYPVAKGTKKLYRFKKNQYYFYTTDACEITPGIDGYILDGDAGYLYSTQIPGTIPVYRSLNGSSIKDHRLSKSKILASDIIVGYLYSTKQPGTIAIYSTISSYEYFPVNYSHYLYSTNFNKDAIISPILGYVPHKVL